MVEALLEESQDLTPGLRGSDSDELKGLGHLRGGDLRRITSKFFPRGSGTLSPCREKMSRRWRRMSFISASLT
jgi:hypothetical protein